VSFAFKNYSDKRVILPGMGNVATGDAIEWITAGLAVIFVVVVIVVGRWFWR
jgi:hypothetical protein